MGKRKELSKFSNIELVFELRERGLVVSAFDKDDLDPFVPENKRKEEFEKIKPELEQVAANAVDKWVEDRYGDVLDPIIKQMEK